MHCFVFISFFPSNDTYFATSTLFISKNLKRIYFQEWMVISRSKPYFSFKILFLISSRRYNINVFPSAKVFSMVGQILAWLPSTVIDIFVCLFLNMMLLTSWRKLEGGKTPSPEKWSFAEVGFQKVTNRYCSSTQRQTDSTLLSSHPVLIDVPRKKNLHCPGEVESK